MGIWEGKEGITATRLLMEELHGLRLLDFKKLNPLHHIAIYKRWGTGLLFAQCMLTQSVGG